MSGAAWWLPDHWLAGLCAFGCDRHIPAPIAGSPFFGGIVGHELRFAVTLHPKPAGGIPNGAAASRRDGDHLERRESIEIVRAAEFGTKVHGLGRQVQPQDHRLA